MPSVDEVRPARCPCCGSASRPSGQGLRLHGHGLRVRQMLGPQEALGEAVAVEVSCRRYLCLICDAVVLVVPGAMLPRRWYSASAIAQALALFGLGQKSPAEIRRQTSPFKVVGMTAAAGWATICRWSPQKGHQRALWAMRIWSRTPTSDLCEKARCPRDGPNTPKPLQKQAHQRAAKIVVSPPLLTHLP